MKENQSVKFSNKPFCPKTAKVMLDCKSLSKMRDKMTVNFIDNNIEFQIQKLFDKWNNQPHSVQPYSDFRNIIEQVRKLPHSNERIKQMNTIIRTVGKPSNLATLLDMLRDSSLREGTEEQKNCKTKLQAVKMHSIYGWCGNTLCIESFDYSAEGTHMPQIGLQEKLGNPTAAWNLTIHIWQPNKNAKGFLLNKSNYTNTIVEPPHTHPFDFVSMIVKGNMHQSIYKQMTKDNYVEGFTYDVMGYYNNIELEHVDGVWPPHEFQKKAKIKTKEHRVLLKEGDSYYMPCNWIHDVEINTQEAKKKPTITLFLSSEYLVMPHVYILNSMADYHKENPNIKQNAKVISEESWHKKLKCISEYLRGESKELNLNNIINYEGEYAFFHRI